MMHGPCPFKNENIRMIEGKNNFVLIKNSLNFKDTFLDTMDLLDDYKMILNNQMIFSRTDDG